MRRAIVWIGLVVALGSGGSAARADHVYTYDSYASQYAGFTLNVFGQNCGDVLFLPNPNIYGARSWAFRFLAETSGVFESIYMPLVMHPHYQESGCEGTMRVSLHASAGDFPGSELASWDIHGITSTPHVFDVQNTDDALQLFEGLEYWVQLGPLDENSGSSWFSSRFGTGYGLSMDTDYGTYWAGEIMPAMIVFVLVEDVPEPGSTSIALGAIGALALRARTARRDARPNGA